MQNEKVLALPQNFEVKLDANALKTDLTPPIERRIQEIWDQEYIRAQGKLFNGKIFSATNFDGTVLQGHFVDYKHYVAQVRDPTLFENLHIQIVSISGYTVANESILIGKRAAYVTGFPGHYELVPAGGIDPSVVTNQSIDIIKQFKKELREEAGIEESMIKSILPVYLIKYSEREPYEICAKIILAPEAALNNPRDEEYTELFWMERKRLPEFINNNREIMIPLSLHLLDLFHSFSG